MIAIVCGWWRKIESFNKPNNWQEIIDECVKALKAIGLDVAAFDVKVAAKDTNEYIIIGIEFSPINERCRSAKIHTRNTKDSK